MPDTQADGSSEESRTALNQFLASMQNDYEKWHDGIGYDLSAIDRMTVDEKKIAVKKLLENRPLTWRDFEAMNHFNTEETRQALRRALKDPAIEVRVAAARYAKDADEDRKAALLEALAHAGLYGGLTQALDQIEQFHPPEVIDALIQGTLKREGEIAVHFAAMLFYLHGKADSSFDWKHRPFFLRFHTTDRQERAKALRELYRIIGLDPERYLTKVDKE